MNKTLKINNFDINKIGIGTWLMGGGWDKDNMLTFADHEHDEQYIKAIRYSLDKGQNHIDTAQMYGAGHCEEVVGEAIKGYDRNKIFVASKVWKAYSQRKAVTKSIEDSLNRLKLDYLDLVYIHSSKNPFPMEEYMAGLNDAVDNGLAKGLAVSNFNLSQLKNAQKMSKHPILANQMLYNILERSDVTNEMLEYCIENNIVLVAYRPIERKLLADNCKNEVVLEIANKYNKTPAQVALNWLISKNQVVAIPKAEKEKHIDENLGSLEFELNKEDIDKLDNIKQNEY